MSLSPTSDMDFMRGVLHEALPAPRMSLIEAAAPEATLAALLGEANVLAVFGFGEAAPARHDDARYLRIALEPGLRDTAARVPFEVWRVAGAVETDCRGAARWASDGDFAFAALELDEATYGGLAATAQQAYLELTRWLDAHGMHALRIWNHVDAINLGAGDDERYRQFCSGRAAGMRDQFDAHGYPAATAIGVRDGRRVLQVYWLAARRRGAAIENPRQINAWRYPRAYGPHAPCFARALRAPTTSAQVFISGTAAIVGHASRHHDDLEAQIEETLANIDSVLDAAQVEAGRFGAHSLIKAYVRRAADIESAARLLRAARPQANPLFLQGDICREELLIEIDGVQGT